MSFAKDIRNAVNKRYKPGYDKVAIESLVALSSSTIEKTPRDTGRARANWLASIDTPKDGTTESTTVDFAAIKSTIDKSVGSTFYLTNNLAYIRGLEFGSSEQAPSGMVRVSTANYQKNIDSAINNLT